jgi:PAS domain S-box-containing protein
MRPAGVGIGRLFEQIRKAVIVAEVDTGQIVLWDPSAERIFGYAAAEVRHHPLAELLVVDPVRQQYAAALAHSGGPAGARSSMPMRRRTSPSSCPPGRSPAPRSSSSCR